MLKTKFLPAGCAIVLLIQILPLAAEASDSSTGTAKGHKAKAHHRNYGLVPPPPPTAVSPTVLAMYPSHAGSLHFMPSKPHNLAETMKLTAVMDDVAFFKLNCTDESIHLKAGNSYETVKVAHINPDEVVLEEKGLQFIKHLK